MRDAKHRLIEGLELFAGTSRRELRWVTSLGTLVDAPAGKLLQRQGDAESEFVVVLAGVVALEHDGRTAAILCAGEAWGDPPRAPQSSRHAATARTRSPATVLVYTSQEYEALLSRCPHIATQLERARALEIRSRVMQSTRTGPVDGVAPPDFSVVGAAVWGGSGT
jgi:CRP-like cAMP-binding protein